MLRHTCSTPYGIRGLDQIDHCVSWAKTSCVLNALRHQRVGSALPAPERLASRCPGAQRLTASEGWIRPTATVFVRVRFQCSTPYGIRGLDQSPLRAPLPRPSSVLNALRHQRVGSARRNRCGLFVHLCAQRLTASEGWISSPRRIITGHNSQCSTPYGIRGLDQARSVRTARSVRAGAQRLTASEGWISATM